MSPLAELRALAPQCFQEAWGADEWARLEQQLAEPKRHYHTMHHVLALARLWSELLPHFKAPNEVFAAVVFHDAVYHALRSDNEERSASLAAAWLANVDGLDLAFVTHLIRLTASHGHHAHTLAGDAALFLDIDMSILGAPEDDYRKYAAGIAAEYSAVPTWLFRRKRNAFLRTVLESPRIYLTDLMEARLGPQARHNLAREVSGAFTKA